MNREYEGIIILVGIVMVLVVAGMWISFMNPIFKQPSNWMVQQEPNDFPYDRFANVNGSHHRR